MHSPRLGRTSAISHARQSNECALRMKQVGRQAVTDQLGYGVTSYKLPCMWRHVTCKKGAWQQGQAWCSAAMVFADGRFVMWAGMRKGHVVVAGLTVHVEG